MRRPVVAVLAAVAVLVTGASVYELAAAQDESPVCWDLYDGDGDRVGWVVEPYGAPPLSCTRAAVCLDFFDRQADRGVLVPIGLDPATCEPTPPTTTTTVPPTTTTVPSTTTTTIAPTTTTSSTTTTTTTTTVAPTTTVTPASGDFLATFDTPADFYDRFDTHTGNYCSDAQPPNCRQESLSDSPPFPGTHNLACAAPPTERTVNVSDHDNLFWWCAPGGAATGHVMTGMNTPGYALVNFSPARSFTNVREVCWDLSLADMGGGKWANVVIVPEATYLSHPNLNPVRVADGEGPYRLDYVTPDFIAPGGPGSANIQNLGSGAGAIVGVKQFLGSAQIYRGSTVLHQDFNLWNAGADESSRWRHCFRDNRNGLLTYTQTRGTGVFTRTASGAFPAGEVRVIFQDDTYDADKHGGTGRYTWHWDNIAIDETG